MKNQMRIGGLAATLVCAAIQIGPVSAEDAPVSITLVGTEYINGVDMTAPYRFAARMTVAFAAGGRNVTIESAGFQATTAEGLKWLTQSKDGRALLAAPSGHPVILELGVIDCSYLGNLIPLDKTKANFDQILDILKAKGVPVLLVGT